MYHNTTKFLPFFLFFITASVVNAKEPPPCNHDDRACVLKQMLIASQSIENEAWRDQTYREIAKTYAADNNVDEAVKTLNLITNPDTKALTIRGIGMALAPLNLSPEILKTHFTTLRAKAEEIKHPPSYAIALTYIAMAQAFADDNEGAWKTASEMENDALRHKAYGETAEIQAEKKNYTAAKISIEKIESAAYKNKSYSIVSKILADQGLLADSYIAANEITNPYKKAQSLQYILDTQKPRDIEK